MGRSDASRRDENAPQAAGVPGMRLQKALAEAGIGSRRKCEELILAGRVEVDGRVVGELGTRVDPQTQQIRVDGDLLKRSRRMYFAVNKPTGVVSTNRDPAGRPRVIDLVNVDERLFPIGRLDASSEGLIIVTNDGALANNLAHPRYGVDKTYLVQVAGSPASDQLEQLRRGIHLAEGFVRVERLQVKKRLKQSAVLEMVLNEGKNREIRRVMARLGHKVLRLKRIAIGTLRLGELPVGAYRPLTVQEVRRLNQCAQRREGDKGGAPRQKRRGFRPPPARGEARAAAGGGGERPTSNVERRTSNGKRPPKHGKFQRPAPSSRPGGMIIEYEDSGDAPQQSGNRPAGGGARHKQHGGRKHAGRKHGGGRHAGGKHAGRKGKRRPRP
jgi:23S rRNA pseudouridine2605 synthase